MKVPSPADMIVDFLSISFAKYAYSSASRDEVLSRIRDGLSSGDLPTQSWIVEDRSRQAGLDRDEFFDWWLYGGGALFAIFLEDKNLLWPPEVFEDRSRAQIDHLYLRWTAHTRCDRPSDFHNALLSACDELAVFRSLEKARSIAREDFVAWFAPSQFACVPSVIANTARAVSADDLWPPPAGTEPWTGMSLKEAVKRAFEMEYPTGLPAGTSIKRRNVILGKRLEQHGVRRPDERSFRRYLNERPSR
jgi:hypothetical protein